VNGTIVSRRGDGLALLGQLDLAIRHGRIIDWRYTEHRVSPFGPTDAAVAQVIGRYEEALNLALGEAIGASAVPLDAGTEASRTRETNLGNLVADALRDWGRTDVGLQNGGGIRGDRVYPPGPITQRDLTTILPFANYGAAVRLSGAELWAVLEHSVGRIDERAGRFLQVSGLAFSYDPAAPVGSRVSAVRVGGAPLDPAAEYTVALSDFLAAGGDDYGVLEGAEVLIPGASGPLLTNLVADYIAARGSVAPVEEGRIRTVGDGD
jgi:2',3'-cyclic-nucleotide 2'-phosphodiesterase (5'-nucleotidase family)